MRDNYFSYYVLSYFKRDKAIKSTQILHVLRGKKTPSMYYLVEVNHWHHGFSIEKQIDKKDLSLIIHAALEKKWLVQQEQGYLLTEVGQEVLSHYFARHYYPKAIDHFMTIDLHQPFWSVFQLFTQVFSEWTYQNKQYTAIIKQPNYQEKIRQLIQASHGKKKRLLDQWVSEQKLIFNHLPTTEANSLANLLTGHQLVGKTRIQLASELGMSLYEFNFYIRDILEQMLALIDQYSPELPILSQLTQQIKTEYFMSLSESTYCTFQLLKSDKEISQIAQLRQLKSNTIKEHILEIAFVLKGFSIRQFLPLDLYEKLTRQFQKQKNYSYREALADYDDLEFYHYRLVELERMRQQ